MLQHDFVRWSHLLQIIALKGNADPNSVKSAVNTIQKDFTNILDTYTDPKSKKKKRKEEQRKRLTEQDKLGFLSAVSDKPFKSMDEIIQTLAKIQPSSTT